MHADWELHVDFVSLLGVRVDCFMYREYLTRKTLRTPVLEVLKSSLVLLPDELRPNVCMSQSGLCDIV